LTDNEIIKALEICNSLSVGCGCGCPYYEIPYKNGKRCSEIMIDDVLDLRNRLQAENEMSEKLTKEILKDSTSAIHRSNREKNKLFLAALETAKSEARKEFAERFVNYLDIGHLRPPTKKCFSELDVKNMLDNLLNEYERKEDGKR
jgi:hypothetical protein